IIALGRFRRAAEDRMFTPEDEAEIKKRLSDVEQDVKMVLFTQTLNCESCPETEALIRELSRLSDHLKLEVLNPYVDRERGEKYGVKDVPALVIEGDQDYGIRFLGAPGGYEFACLLEDIIAVGRRESGLSPASKELLQSITEPLDLKVFVTPT